MSLVVAVTVVAARWGHPDRTVAWDWGIGSAVATAGGTTLLAIGTFLLAWGTRRPELSLQAGEALATHSHVERDGRPHVRLLVANRRGRRSAAGARVILEGYRSQGGSLTTLGSPSLGWPSVPEATDASVVIFGGVGRPVDFGQLWRVRANDGRLETTDFATDSGTVVRLPLHRPDDQYGRWYLRLGLSHGLVIGDFREFLPPGPWTIRVVVGAEEAAARRFDVDVWWDGDAPDAAAALKSVKARVRPVG